MKRNFLVVAPSASLRETLAGDLRSKGYTVTRAANGKEAQRSVKSVSFDAVIVESHLPDMSTDELRKRLAKVRPECRVIVLTSFGEVRNSPEQLQFADEDFLIETGQFFEMLRAPYEVPHEAAQIFAHRGTEALIQVIDVLVGLLEVDDRFFGGSSHKAMRLARAITEELAIDEATATEVVIGTLLRDVGKAAIDAPQAPDEPYNAEQQERMREHVLASTRIFEHIDFPWKVLPLIRNHHEHYDGSGYPDGLRGREIPMGARIVSVVDAFMSLTSHREHRPAVDAETALGELVSQAGRHFDPEVVEALQRVLDKTLLNRSSKKKPQVLVADPDADFRKLLKMRLLNEDLEVEEADGPENLLPRLLKGPPDLVLVDLDADPAATFQLLQEIREDEHLCRVPVALLSGRSDRVLKIRALREGVDDFLDRSEDMEELVARVQNVLAREAIRSQGRRQPARRGITGDLENLGLPDIVQTLVMGMKTACVTVTSQGRSGRVWFENGVGRHAQSGKLNGEKAFFELVSWTSGEFVIEHGVRSKEQSLKQDAMFLLMEGLRLLDESQRDTAAAAS